jgi:hypothetical protein
LHSLRVYRQTQPDQPGRVRLPGLRIYRRTRRHPRSRQHRAPSTTHLGPVNGPQRGVKRDSQSRTTAASPALQGRVVDGVHAHDVLLQEACDCFFGLR